MSISSTVKTKNSKVDKKIDAKARERIQKALKEKPKMSNRGHPTTNLETYIKDSKAQVAQWQKILKTEKKSMTK